MKQLKRKVRRKLRSREKFSKKLAIIKAYLQRTTYSLEVSEYRRDGLCPESM